MSALLKRLKSIDPKIKLTVFGYVRQNECKLKLFSIVSSMISYLCLAYFHLAEYFEKAGDDIEISEDEMTITKIVSKSYPKNKSNTSYGKLWIDSNVAQIVEWKFKINVANDNMSILIALVSKDNRLNGDTTDSKDAPNYSFYGRGGLFIKDTGAKSGRNRDRNMYRFGKSDEISMTLDTKFGKLYFKKNGGDKLLLVKNMNMNTGIRYKMAVSMRYKKDSIFLIDFKCDFV